MLGDALVCFKAQGATGPWNMLSYTSNGLYIIPASLLISSAFIHLLRFAPLNRKSTRHFPFSSTGLDTNMTNHNGTEDR